jgi:NADH-quinone oxidoreductase subunit J
VTSYAGASLLSAALAAPATAPATMPASVTSTGEAVLFWVLGPLAVLAALGMVLTRKAVHSALLLAVVMISLAVFYITQGAPFLGVVQIVVYTGAVMMLFLFVLMLVGVDASDSLVETIRGQRVAAAAAGLGFGLLLVAGLSRADALPFTGLAAASPQGNVVGLAELIYTRYVVAFEITGVLLIVATVAAMVLAHREPTEPRKTQRERAVERMLGGGQVSTLPSPGVYARHNAVDTPALLPDGSPSRRSVPAVLVARGDARPAHPADMRELTRGEDRANPAAGEDRGEPR